MDLDIYYQTLNFFVNKAQGQYFPPGQLDQITDVAQMSVFNDFFIKFLASQRIDDALAPFYKQFTFSSTQTPGGLLTVPSDYYHCESLYAIVQDAQGNTRQRGIVKLNTDELPGRLNSQIFPPTVMDPVYITSTNWNIQIYPQTPQAGVMFYLARPSIPHYAYTTNTRGITYDKTNSVQLEWGDSQIHAIIIKVLEMLGVNTREDDIVKYAMTKDQQDISTPDKL